MSYGRYANDATVEIVCDHTTTHSGVVSSCPAILRERGVTEDQAARRVLWRARVAGWRMEGDRHLCPHHGQEDTNLS